MISAVWVAFKVSMVLFAASYFFCMLLRPADAAWVKRKLMPVAIGLYPVGMLVPNVWFFWAALFAVPIVFSRNRVEASCLYVIAVLFSPTVGRQLGIGSIYLLALDKWLFCALGLWASTLAKPLRGARPRGWYDVPFWLIIALNVVLARGLNFTSTMRAELDVVLGFILPYYCFTRALRQPEDMRKFLITASFAAFVLALVGFYEYRASFLPYETIQNHLGTSLGINPYSKQRSGGLRASTSFPESTTFGLFLAMGFMAVLTRRDIFKAKRFWVASMGVLIVGIYATNARSAFIAVGLGILAYDVYRKRYTSLAVKCGLISLVYAIALLIAQFSPSVAERIGVGGSSISTVDYREQLVRRGSEEIAKHPFIGVDPDAAYTALADLRQGEGIVDFVNAYVYYGMVAGVPGIIALALTFILMAWNALKIRKRLRYDVRLIEIGGAVFGIGVFTLVTTYTSGFGGRPAMIFLLFAGLGSALATVRKPTAEAGDPADAGPQLEPPRPRLRAAGAAG